MAQTVDENLLDKKNPMDEVDARKDERLQARLREAKQRAREAKIKDEGLGKKGRKIGKKVSTRAKKKIAQGSEGVFYILIFIAAVVDLIAYLDLGTFSTLANMGVYIIVVVGGFIMWFFKSSKNQFSIFNLLKGQLWKYLVMPLLELVPLINLLPFWTGTVVMMWMKVKREKRKMIKAEERALKKLKVEYA